MEVGWLPLGFAVAGVALGEWWKFGLTGRHLTPVEAIRDGLATGLLAASSSPLAILQAPREWSDLLALSGIVAAVAAALYHAANAVKLASSGRHLGGIAGALIVGTPYAVGGLVLLESAELMQTLGSLLSAGALSGHPDAGRVPRAGGGPLRLQRGGGQRPRPGDEADPAPVGEGAPGAAGRGGRRDRRALDRGPGLGRAGRLLAERCPACWPSWRPRSCRRRGSGPRGIS